VHATMSLAGAQDKIGLRFDKKTRKLSDSVGHSAHNAYSQARYSPSTLTTQRHQ